MGKETIQTSMGKPALGISVPNKKKIEKKINDKVYPKK